MNAASEEWRARPSSVVSTQCIFIRPRACLVSVSFYIVDESHIIQNSKDSAMLNVRDTHAAPHNQVMRWSQIPYTSPAGLRTNGAMRVSQQLFDRWRVAQHFSRRYRLCKTHPQVTQLHVNSLCSEGCHQRPTTELYLSVGRREADIRYRSWEKCSACTV